MSGRSMTVTCKQFLRAIPAKLHEEDKRKHVAWSFWLLLLAGSFLSPWQAFVLVFLIGLGKECWDRFYGSGFCFYDMIGNMLGILAGLALILPLSWWFAGPWAVSFM